ncbi:hypothetical protein BJ170DRAFT_642684 [Xylariales sp. AK1849]|nr:hypothetical protein BJ170DRAFT_642684 [Xylariales sp. AK1849]
MITHIAFNSISYNTYTIFAVINAFMVPCVYFFYPETAYWSLEEMDAIFHRVKGAKGYFGVVKVAREEPRRYGKNGELLLDYEGTEKHKAHTQHDECNGASPRETENTRGAVLGSS